MMEDNDPHFKSDPLCMESFLGKLVEVKTIENKMHTGRVYTVDPISKCIILITKANGTNEVHIIFYHAIQSLCVLLNSTINQEFLLETKNTIVEDFKQVQDLKFKVVAWLKKNMVNVQEDGLTLKVEDHLTIEPPYGIEQCLCSNTIILERIRTLISNMPCDIL